MGLSNEERLTKMMWAIRGLTNDGYKLRALLDNDKNYNIPHNSIRAIQVICDSIENLWHAYLGTSSNGGYWILGGDISNPISSAGAPWSTAIMYHCEMERMIAGGFANMK